MGVPNSTRLARSDSNVARRQMPVAGIPSSSCGEDLRASQTNRFFLYPPPHLDIQHHHVRPRWLVRSAHGQCHGTSTKLTDPRAVKTAGSQLERSPLINGATATEATKPQLPWLQHNIDGESASDSEEQPDAAAAASLERDTSQTTDHTKAAAAVDAHLTDDDDGSEWDTYDDPRGQSDEAHSSPQLGVATDQRVVKTPGDTRWVSNGEVDDDTGADGGDGGGGGGGGGGDTRSCSAPQPDPDRAQTFHRRGPSEDPPQVKAAADCASCSQTPMEPAVGKGPTVYAARVPTPGPQLRDPALNREAIPEVQRCDCTALELSKTVFARGDEERDCAGLEFECTRLDLKLRTALARFKRLWRLVCTDPRVLASAQLLVKLLLTHPEYGILVVAVVEEVLLCAFMMSQDSDALEALGKVLDWLLQPDFAAADSLLCNAFELYELACCPDAVASVLQALRSLFIRRRN